MKNLKKILPIFLAIFIFALLSITVSAEMIYVPGREVSSDEDLFLSVGGDVTSIISNDKVLISDDFTLEGPITIVSGSYELGGAGATVIVSGQCAFIVKDGGELILGNKTESGDNEGLSFVSSGADRNNPYIIVEKGGKLSLYGGVSFGDNVSGANGGAIVNYGEVYFYNAKINNCRSLLNGGAFYNVGTLNLVGGTVKGSSAENGGAIYNEGTVNLAGTEINGNVANLGGAIYNVGEVNLVSSYVGNSKAKTGGAIYNDGVLNLLGGQIELSEADENGGAIYNSDKGECVNSGAYVNNGKCGDNGGVIYNEGKLTMTSGSFTDGEAILGGCIYNSGVLKLDSGSITNGDAIYGGSIYNSGLINMSGGSMSLSKAEFGKAVFNAGEMHLSGYPYIDAKYDLFILIDDNSSHAVYIDSEMKADTIAKLSAGRFDDEGNVIAVFDNETVLLQGEFVSQGSSHFDVISNENDEYKVDSGKLYRVRSVWEGWLIYVVIAFAYIGVIFGIIFFVRFYDKKKSKENVNEKRTKEN